MIAILLGCAAVVTAWLLVWALARRGEARDRARARAESRAAVLRDVGLDVEGDPLGEYTLQGAVHGVEVSVEGRATSPVPSASSPAHPGVTAITVRAALPDQVVCRRSDAEAIVGVDAPPPRPTGDPRFDEQYVVVVEGSPRDHAAGYRDPSAEGLAPTWSDAAMLGAMAAERLVLLRARDGSCRFAFPPASAHDVGPLLALAANVARSAAGEPPVATGERPFVAPVRSFEPVRRAIAWGPRSLLLAPAAFLLAFAPPLRRLNAEAECGAGGEIRVSENDTDDGTSYGLHCWNRGEVWGPPLAAHYASALAIVVALTFGAVTALALARWPTKARF